MRTYLAVVSAALLILGCAEQRAVHSVVAVPEPDRVGGLAEVYVFNVSGWTLFPSNQEVTNNRTPFVSLPRETYKKVHLPAGKHVLRTVPEMPWRTLTLDVEEGRRYYVAAGYRPEKSLLLPLAGDSVVISAISEGDAQRLMSAFKAQ